MFCVLTTILKHLSFYLSIHISSLHFKAIGLLLSLWETFAF
jgi:hypothetical protein